MQRRGGGGLQRRRSHNITWGMRENASSGGGELFEEESKYLRPKERNYAAEVDLLHTWHMAICLARLIIFTLINQSLYESFFHVS